MSEAGEVTSSELGIRSFFRGILPQWSKSSPVGAASPNDTNTNSIENGLDELHTSEQTHLKRKISLIESDDSDDSDSDEQHPTCKRQRINMSTMSRLFSKFSISDSSISKSQEQKVTSNNYFLHSSIKKDSLIKLPIYRSNNDTDGEALASSKSIQETLINNNRFHIINMNGNTSSKSSIMEENPFLPNRREEESKETVSHNPQISSSNNNPSLRTRNEEKTKEETVPSYNRHIALSNENLPLKNKKEEKRKPEVDSSYKRQITLSDDNDSDNDTEHVAKVKRTRRLRRGLKLCTDITCYIEQVIYS